ncbi:MAG: Two component transcriptional regulator, winged helix family [Candidatus Woesebacteria bacterium GW2011_GWA1_37_8]|uniref:Two component transcriptional regulator, winged helix family n=2 Tax=Candidatus Woeseibacteriota TaxID=1752722 RepID=A0A0G0L8G7_9BACT|nr:MAG: Two component transcriptional regulator, winged helix family [Microgenomates group bacterium GW2011_GWC1_37_12b]KKQ44132.1 MAG: Two component transcriptional regulator, winged helix family [Candidatus Woesebacteria bacterium GW2011_GWA1_37_8]KKQ87287.1 MAG: Two component transcriptional regulator, winged helix family [Candidatus Woesebacteria bacterium GW2011_GWB1_38_8b]
MIIIELVIQVLIDQVIMRILIVEDDHKIAQSIKKGLEQEGYAVDITFDGEDAYDFLTTESYELVVLDLMLPGIDGVTLCKKLREEGNHIAILMLTAKGAVGDKVDGLNSGADDYLTKPFAFAELVARVKALTRRPRETLNPILSFGELTLNTSTYEVKRSGVDVNLSRKEFALLEYLLRHKGKVVTKEQIIASIWNYDDDILPNTVEVFVGFLRAKIEKPFKKLKPIIKTVRGFGYKIDLN